MSTEKLKKIYWQEVRQDLRKVNLVLATIIDTINPGRNLPLIRNDYFVGDTIVNQGKCDFFNMDSPFNPNLDLLSYSRVPLGVLLNQPGEMFVKAEKGEVSLCMLSPGSPVGLFETINVLCNFFNRWSWNVRAGVEAGQTDSDNNVNDNDESMTIFFTKPWIKHLQNNQDRSWLELREYLFREAWQQANLLIEKHSKFF